MRAEEVIQAVAELCRHFSAVEVILFGSRAKGTALERSDIDVAVSGVKDFDALAEAKQRDLSDSFVLPYDITQEKYFKRQREGDITKWTYTFTNADYDAAVARGPMTEL